MMPNVASLVLTCSYCNNSIHARETAKVAKRSSRSSKAFIVLILKLPARLSKPMRLLVKLITRRDADTLEGVQLVQAHT